MQIFDITKNNTGGVLSIGEEYTTNIPVRQQVNPIERYNFENCLWSTTFSYLKIFIPIIINPNIMTNIADENNNMKYGPFVLSPNDLIQNGIHTLCNIKPIVIVTIGKLLLIHCKIVINWYIIFVYEFSS